MNWQGKRKYSEKTCPGATLSTTNPSWTGRGSNPGHRGGNPAANRLSYGVASQSLYQLRYPSNNQILMHFIYLFTFSFHLMHSFVWLSKWISLLQHLVQSLHYFSHTPLVWLFFKLFCCCFSRIENVKSNSDVLFHLVMYMETVLTISRWWFNLHTHWCECHCWVVLFYTFSVFTRFVHIPCKQLS
jgi:hypothetical protein